jgi:NADH-quinone oxidoreductase subunit N
MITLVILALVGLFLMIAGIFDISRKASFGVAFTGMVVALASNLYMWDKVPMAYFNRMIVIDNYDIAFISAVLCISMFLFLLSENYFGKIQNYLTEHYALYLFAIVGMIAMISFNNLVMLFIGIEILSVSLYILAGSEKNNPASNEASLKYFLMGAFATGILLMGITLIYGASGSFYLSGIEEYFTSGTELSAIAYVGMFLVLIGMSFKMSIAPFHFWTPDVYDGSPTFVTAFMSTIVKIAGFASFFKLFYICFSSVTHFWMEVVAVLAALTITVGSMSAINQKSLKRLLAFSSVSHAGYMLIVVLVGANSDDLMYYMIAYAIGSIVAFGVMMLIENETGNTDISSFDGLAKQNPFLGFIMTVAMLSLAGIPLTAGFMAKFYVLSSALNAGHTILVVVAILNAMVGIYYYFKVIIAIYFKEAKNTALTTVYPATSLYKIVLFLGIIAIIVLGICPDIIHNLI